MALSLPFSWFSGFTALLTLIGAVPALAESVLCPEGSLQPLSQSMVFEKFDAWFYQLAGLTTGPQIGPLRQGYLLQVPAVVCL